jgi:poly(A) polymerase
MKQTGSKKEAGEIARRLREAGYLAYFAGGCVRDLIMKQAPKDYDIATTANPDEIARLFPRCIPVGKQFGVMIVVSKGMQFEVAAFRREGEYVDGRHPSGVTFTTPEEDAKRRDFTVNGLFYDPLRRRVIDYVDGKMDIARKLIRAIGDPEERFHEDRLRLLRAVRFAANLGFTIESKTWSAIRHLRKEIYSVSQERVRDELIKMLTRAHAGRALDLLSDSGLLAEILPEIEAMKGVQQPPEFHPEGDVYIHTRMLLDRMENPSVALAFGALLHDVGKPVTFSDEGGKIHFYNHARIGAELSRQILIRFRFSNREITDITSCVEHHMKFADVQKMRVGKLKRFIARDNFKTELELHRIDCLSSHGKLNLYRFLKNRLQKFKQEELKPKPLVSGTELIALGFHPGPIFKKILNELYEMQLEGKLTSQDEALKRAKRYYTEAGGKIKE